MSEHLFRRRNLLSLYSRFVAEAIQASPEASPAGLDKAFANRIQIANSSFSSYKSGARPIGPRIARQIESLLEIDTGWMDQPNEDQRPVDDDVELSRFLKLAERAFQRASLTQREMLSDVMRLTLGGGSPVASTAVRRKP